MTKNSVSHFSKFLNRGILGNSQVYSYSEMSNGLEASLVVHVWSGSSLREAWESVQPNANPGHLSELGIPVILAFWLLRQESWKLPTSFGYLVRLCLKMIVTPVGIEIQCEQTYLMFLLLEIIILSGEVKMRGKEQG